MAKCIQAHDLINGKTQMPQEKYIMVQNLSISSARVASNRNGWFIVSRVFGRFKQ